MRKNFGTILGAATLVVLGGLGAWFGAAPRPTLAPDRKATPITEVATSTTPAPEWTAGQQQIINLLPAGYDTTTCQPVDPPPPTAVAAVDCFANADPGSESGRYSLYPDLNSMNNRFLVDIGQYGLEKCPDGDSPGKWHYNSNPDVDAGSMFCAGYNGNAMIEWTRDAALIIGNVQGAGLTDLYGWWQYHVGPGPITPLPQAQMSRQ
jgi:serine/threonine kinase PknH